MPAAETAGEDGDLADLALLGRDVAHVEHLLRLVDVDIATRAEHVQHLLTVARQPRRQPRLDGRPIGDGKRPAHGGPQHGLEDVSSSRAELRHDRLTGDDSRAHGLGVFVALAPEVVDLQTVGRRAPGGAAASEDERTAHPVILNVGQIGHPLKLGDRRGPKIVG